MDLTSADLMSAMHLKSQACDQFYVTGRATLEQSLKGITGKKDFVHPMWGMWDKIPEPSLCAEFDVENGNLNQVKRAVIEFGKQYNQKAVHITRSLGHDPYAGCQHFLHEHGSLEIAWLATLSSAQDISGMARLIEAVDAPGLSLMDYGIQLLVYTINNPERRIPGFPKFFQDIRNQLNRPEPMEFGVRTYTSTDLIMEENVWVMELVSYGTKGEAPHTYDEGLRLFRQSDLKLPQEFQT